MKKLNDLFFKLAEVTLVIMLSAMVIMVFGNVVLRYGFNDGIISSEELSRFLFIWITFLGAIVTMRDNGHLGLDSVVRKLSLQGKKIAFGISNVLMLGCCVLMFYGTLKQHGINATTRSAVADTAALAAVLLPMMRKAGYRMDRSAGLIAAGGIIAPVIPPSIGFILFGVIGGVSISKLFMAGIFPGLMMGFALIVTWWIVARKDNVVVADKVPFKERISVTINAFWSYLLAIVIIGGMKMGIFTPTEAAVVAVVYSLFVGLFIYREIKFKDLYRIILSAAKTSSVVMFLVAAALVSAWLITVANIPAQIVEILRPLIDNKTLLMVVLMLLVMIVGTALDFAPTVLILTPVLMPLVREAGIDPVYFGVLFIMNNAIGLLTPPVGTVLNVVCGVGRIPMHDVIRGVMPFLLSQVVVMGSLIAFPSLVMVPLKWMLMR
jgi:tripartite ATP-independent transporter DctM subunit